MNTQTQAQERMPIILIVEDDRDLADLNARMLRRRGYEVLVANTAAAARTFAADCDADVYVLDITLPDGDGFSLCAELRRKTDAPIVFLTGRKESRDKVEGLTAGGDYYLTKPFDRNEFLAVIKSMLRRAEQERKKVEEAVEEAVVEAVEESAVVTRGSLTLDCRAGRAFVGGRDAGLTQKEFAVLHLLIRNEGRELSNDEIYRQIWGTETYGDSNALRQLVSRMKKKIGEDDTDDFTIRNERRKGYIFTTE